MAATTQSNVSTAKSEEHLRSTLPKTLMSWRVPGESWEEEVALWEAVRSVFERARIDLWRTPSQMFQRARSGELNLSSGFAYLTPRRCDAWADHFKRYNWMNALTHGATTADGHSVMVRVVAIGEEGKGHLAILRKIAQGTPGLLSNNHTIPLWRELCLQDIVFGVFPYVGSNMGWCYMDFLSNSVGDIVDMILQCLEALAFIHSVGISHRDTEKSNFLVQWHPESLADMRVPVVRPRVYLNDFEFALEYPGPSSTTSIGPPGGYQREVAPEVRSGRPYDAFKPDVWQFGYSLSDFRSTIPAVDDVLNAIVDMDATTRPSASEARDQLADVLHSITPASLLIPPQVVKRSVEDSD